MQRLFILLAFFLVLGVSLYVGPFGLEFGMTLEQVKSVATIDGQSKDKSFMYWITPIKKSSFFSDYRIMVSPKYGLFDILAFGNIIDSDAYGEKIREYFKLIIYMVAGKMGNLPT